LLTRFLELHVFNESTARGILPSIFPRDDADPKEISRLESEVSRAAGRANDATSLTNTYIGVRGMGAIDPIAAWHTMTQPKPVLEPANVLAACDLAIGRLDAMVRKAPAEAPPAIGAAAMHPIIWGAAKWLWRDRHFRAAVAAAADALISQVKIITGRNDVSETSLWQETFSRNEATPDKPRLRWPGESNRRDVTTMNDGLRQFAPGVQMTIRNPAAHATGELGEQEALERLATRSLLARWVEECQLLDGTENQG